MPPAIDVVPPDVPPVEPEASAPFALIVPLLVMLYRAMIGMFVGPLPTTFTVTPLLTTIVVA
jgi:hypothetical protein